MSADCLFCKISAKKIPSKIVYEDPDVFAFDDISPQAPTHILICPRKHFESLTEATPKTRPSLANCNWSPRNWPASAIFLQATARS